jgi:serine/threonine protein kinase
VGLVHNDLNSANVMLDDDDKPVIIDHDSCKPHREPLGAKPGMAYTKTHSKYANDQESLNELKSQLTTSAASARRYFALEIISPFPMKLSPHIAELHNLRQTTGGRWLLQQDRKRSRSGT